MQNIGNDLLGYNRTVQVYIIYTMRKRAATAAALCTALASLATVATGDVLQLTDETFAAARAAHPLLFVKWFAPW
jgi:hypothetical protein